MKYLLKGMLAVALLATASMAQAKDYNPPQPGSACDKATQAFIGSAGGNRVYVRINEEKDGGVSFLMPSGVSVSDFPIGELNGELPRLERQDEVVASAQAHGAWAVQRRDGRMRVFVAEPARCPAVFGN